MGNRKKKSDIKDHIIIAIIVIFFDACLILLGWKFGYDYTKRTELHITKENCIQLFNSLN